MAMRWHTLLVKSVAMSSVSRSSMVMARRIVRRKEEAWMQWGEEGPPPYGTRGLSQSTPLGSADTLGVSNGPRAGKDPTQERSLPLALASLVLGSRRSETGLFEIGFGELARARHGHETRQTRGRSKAWPTAQQMRVLTAGDSS